MTWVVGADKDLRIVHRSSWDGNSAKANIFKWAGFPKNPDPSKAKRAFFLYNDSEPNLKASYKDPFADVVNGELVAVDAGIVAAAGRLPQTTDATGDAVNRAVAVKDSYMKKIHSKEKSETEVEEKVVDFVITKASLGNDGIMRWAATVSKFSPDDQNDEVTKEFYQRAIEHVEKGDFPMPALVVSHFDDPRMESVGKPVPEVFVAGDTTSMYIDHNQPKAKGTFKPTPLGKALFEGVRSDIAGNLPDNERIRISMAFRPATDGIEKSENDVIRYTDGHIRHFAATRVPIVKETELITIEKSEVRKTRYEDAATIVGPEIAAELDKSYKELIVMTKSEPAQDNGLIEKAEDMKGKMKYMKDGKFDMGSCIGEMMGEGGKDRKQAIAVCLSMSRGKSKAEVAEAEMPMTVQLFDHGLCMKQYVAKNWSEASAAAFCDNQLVKMMLSEEPVEEAATTTQKSDLNTFMDAVVSDDTIKVVATGSETTTVSKSDESEEGKSGESVNQPAQAATAVAEETTESQSTGQSQTEKSDADKGVNVAEKSVTEPDDPVAGMVNLFKAALSDTSMDRSQRVAVINSVLQNLGQYAEERIQSVPPTTNDQAEMLKSALSEIVGPLTEEIQKLRTDNEKMKAALKGGFVDQVFKEAKTTPRQLQHQNVQKAGIEGDTGGALNSKQIAESTIRYGQIG